MSDKKKEDKVVLVLTRPAVDRLIGGDSEAEVQLRAATAEEILKKHIVPLLVKEPVQKIMDLVRKGVEHEFEKMNLELLPTKIAKDRYGYTTRLAVLPDTVVKEVHQLVKDRFDNAVRDVANDVMDTLQSQLKEIVTGQIQLTVREEVKKQVRDRFSKMMQE